jgi:hypothetical protein
LALNGDELSASALSTPRDGALATVLIVTEYLPELVWTWWKRIKIPSHTRV